MEKQSHNQFIEELLDAGLARYSNVTPRPGLEERLLATARSEQERRSWFVWAGWLAAGAVAALIVVGVFNVTHRPTRPAPPPPVATGQTAPQTVASVPPVAPAGESRPSRRVALERVPRTATQTARQETRLEVFPSPQPLTDEEKLLVQYVRQTPAEVLSASSTDSAPIPDLEMKPLDIAPLDTEETETKTN